VRSWRTKLLWSSEGSELSQNNRELRGALRCIQALKPHLVTMASRVSTSSQWGCLRVETDNTVCAAYTNHQGGRTLALNEMAIEMVEEMAAIRILLRATHIPGTEMEGELGEEDGMSRDTTALSQYHLLPEHFPTIEKALGAIPPHIPGTRNRQWYIPFALLYMSRR
jgi:hypothetical protein